MSASPPKKSDVEPGAQSPDDSEPHMDRETQDTQAQGLAYEFEVKEQDRWLPIANGWSFMRFPLVFDLCALPITCMSTNTMTGIASSLSLHLIARLNRSFHQIRSVAKVLLDRRCLKNGRPADLSCLPYPHSLRPRRHNGDPKVRTTT